MQRVITMGRMGQAGPPSSQAESYIPTPSELGQAPASQAPASQAPASQAPASGSFPVTATWSPTDYLPSLGGSLSTRDLLTYSFAAFILGYAIVKYRSQLR